MTIGKSLITRYWNQTVPTTYESQGLLRILITENNFRPFCKNRFTLIDAHVACTSSGFPGALTIVDGAIYGHQIVTTSGVVDLNCTGTELSLRECPQFKLHLIEDCTSVVGVICKRKHQFLYTLIH